MDAVDVIRKKLANPSVGQCDDYAEYLTEWAETIVSALTASGHLMGWSRIDEHEGKIPDGSRVLLWTTEMDHTFDGADYDMVVGYYDSRRGDLLPFYEQGTNHHLFEPWRYPSVPTHFMPLPAPPEEKE